MALSALAGNFVANTGTGNQAITGVGFQPKALIFGFVAKTADGVGTGDGKYAVAGMAVSSTQRAAVCFADDAARHTNVKCLVMVNGASTLLAEADLVTMDSDGFTINWSTAPSGAWIIPYVAFGGGGRFFLAAWVITYLTGASRRQHTR